MNICRILRKLLSHSSTKIPLLHDSLTFAPLSPSSPSFLLLLPSGPSSPLENNKSVRINHQEIYTKHNTNTGSNTYKLLEQFS